MHNLKHQFEVLKERDQALITPIVKARLWELTLPVLWQTTYARTSLVLRVQPRISTLTDNGSVSNGNGFRHPQLIHRQLARLRVKDHLTIVSNRFTAAQIAEVGSNRLLLAVNDFIRYLTALDRIMKANV